MSLMIADSHEKDYASVRAKLVNVHIWHSGKAASFIHKNTETVFQKQHEKSVITEAQESMD